MFIGHNIQLVAQDPAVWSCTCVSKRRVSYNVDRKVLGLPLMTEVKHMQQGECAIKAIQYLMRCS